ncbi:MAG: efflux transporter outer membrane subunit [Acidobacteriota bacterium]
MQNPISKTSAPDSRLPTPDSRSACETPSSQPPLPSPTANCQLPTANWLCLLLLLSSCAKTPPRPAPQVEVPVPQSWQSALLPEGEVQSEWWTSFGDSQLDRIIAEALNRNYDLTAAAARLQAAEAQARISGAGQLPSADASLDGSRRRQNFVGFPIPGSGSRVLTTNSTNLGVSFNISWEADVWGRIRDGAQASWADVQTSRAELQGLRQSLAAQTAKAWFALAEIRQQMELAQSTLESYQSSAERIRRRYEQGLLPPLDLRLALSNIHTTQAQLERRRDELQRARRQLEIILGRYPRSELENSSDMPELPPTPPGGVPSELLNRRPDLVAAEWRLAAADARFNEARKAFYPRLNLSGGTGTAGQGLGDLVDPGLFVWNLASSLLQPVFQGGRLRAGADLSQAQIRQAVADFASTLLQAFSEVEAALAAEGILARNESELGELVEQNQAALRLAEDQYHTGLQNYITVLEAQRRTLVSRTQLISLRRRRLENRIDLHLALAGGFEVGSSGITAEGAERGDAQDGEKREEL